MFINKADKELVTGYEQNYSILINLELMKIVYYILFTILSSNLFAQNKHCELYYQVETICKTIFKFEINDSLDIFGRKINAEEIRIVLHDYPPTKMPLLVIDGVPFNNYGILDTMDYKSIVSIQILKPNFATSLYGSRATIGLILLTTIEERERQINHKKKKRKSK